MPLSPQARAIVDGIVASAPPPEQIGAAAAREASDARRAAQPREVEAVGVVEDRTIPGPGGDLRIRVYRPVEGERLPVTVFFHGGGWVLCDLDSHDPMCRTIANGADTVVVAVDYRRAPESRFPAALDDAYAALEWTIAHAAELGVDPRRIAVAGDSSGGNLAAAVALRARDGGPTLAAQLLLYPVIDSRMDTESYRQFGHASGLEASSMRWYWEQYVPRAEGRTDPLASPAYADELGGLPPAIVAAAECDPLHDEAIAYVERLAAAGVPTWSRTYPSGFHGFLSLPTGMLPVADEAMAELLEQLRKALA